MSDCTRDVTLTFPLTDSQSILQQKQHQLFCLFVFPTQGHLLLFFFQSPIITTTVIEESTCRDRIVYSTKLLQNTDKQRYPILLWQTKTAAIIISHKKNELCQSSQSTVQIFAQQGIHNDLPMQHAKLLKNLGT